MMKTLDQGLGAMGLIGLAVVLTALVTIGIPISVSTDTVELSDWLGFAGNIISAAVTLAAAYAAWRAVQHQIRSQNDAMLLDVTTREEDRLEAELHAISVLTDLALKVVQVSDAALPYSPVQERLQQLGLLGDSVAIRQALQVKVGGPISPRLLNSYEGAFIRLRSAAEQCRSLTERSVGQEQTKAMYSSYARDLKSLLFHTLERQIEIRDKLLPAYRARIEAGLRGLHG